MNDARKERALEMESEERAFIFQSPDLQELLADNDTALVDLLTRAGHRVHGSFGVDPAQLLPGHREPVLMLLGAASLLAMIQPTILKVIEELSHRPVLVTEKVCVPVTDPQGGLVVDSAGNPVCHWVDRSHLIEPKPGPDAETKVRINGLGIHIALDVTHHRSPPHASQ